MRRVISIGLGALAFAITASAAFAQTEEPPSTTTSTTVRPTTTTAAPPVTIGTTSTTSTTVKPSTGATTTTTAKGTTTGKPIPPPPSGTSQTLVPSLLGGDPIIPTSSTLFGVETVTVPTQPQANGASSDPFASVAVTKTKNGPNGTTLVLAAVAWLASLGGLLVYAEDQRGLRWRHLAR